MEEKHLSPEELAARLDVPVETIYFWNKKRSGPRYMKVGRHVRYRLADIRAWEESRVIRVGGGNAASA